VFSTRYKISSNRPSAGHGRSGRAAAKPWMVKRRGRARAPDSPVPGEYTDVRTARPDGEQPECKTPEQMKMANAFCRYLEMAAGV
jgi:hypothetical protein